MRILMQDAKYTLLEQYGFCYIRYTVDNVVYQLSVTSEAREKLLTGAFVMSDIVKDYETAGLCDVSCMRRMHVKACIKNSTGYSGERLDKVVDKLETYDDIFSEFYRYVLYEAMPVDGALVSVKGFTAPVLCENYMLTPLGAYNYLIYLRECPRDAMRDLKKLVRN